jgi:signal transduction histidine kinase
METKSLYAHIFDAIRDPILVVDEGGDVQAANASAMRLFDFAHEDRPRAPGTRLSVDARALASLVQAGDRVRGVPVLDCSGRETGVEVDIEPMPAPARHRLLHFRARTDSIQRELWTDEAVASVAHEFRNPLSSMMNALEVMASGGAGELNAAQNRFLGAFRRGTARLARLVDGYLDLARVRAGALCLAREHHDVRSLVGEIADDFLTLHPALAGRLVRDVAADVRAAYVDRDRLAQVLLNLVANAIRFTPPDRSVAVRVSRAGREALDDDLRLLPWEVLGDPRWVRIDVEDEGIGMGPETLAHAFQPYHGSESATPASTAGAHLGLHIARALVEAQDGWVAIESRLGMGTTIRVFVPEDQDTATRVSRLRAAAATLGRLRAARRDATLAVIAGEGGGTVRACAEAWRGLAAVNPARSDVPPGRASVWTLSDDVAVAIVPGHHDGVEIGRQLVRLPARGDDPGTAPKQLSIGTWAVDDQATFTQVFCRAASRLGNENAGAERTDLGAVAAPLAPGTGRGDVSR